MKSKDDFLYDVRIINRNIRDGVVSKKDYDKYLDSLREAGQTGDNNEAYNRLQNLPGTGATPEAEGDH